MTESPLDEREIAELRELLAKATPGPFVADGDITIVSDRYGGPCSIAECQHLVYYGSGGPKGADLFREAKANTDLIVAAVNALPSLLTTIDALRAERDALAAELAKARGQVDDALDHLATIDQWASAYPEDIFPPINAKEYVEALKAAGLSSDRLHASWARHITKGIGGLAAKARTALGEGE